MYESRKPAAPRLSKLYEAFLSHGTVAARSDDVLMIRRARGFALIGMGCLFLSAFVFGALTGLPKVFGACVGMLFVLVATTALSFVDNGRFIRPITHFGMGSMLAGIVAVALQIGYVNPITSTFPILLVLASTYELGVREGLFWTAASIIALGWSTLSLELPLPPDGATTVSKLGFVFTGALVMAAAYALAATERHFGDARRKQLDFLARHDPLTGLSNRRALEQHLYGTWKRCQRYSRRFAVLVVDLDGFKLVNDEHGHGAGDALLIELAERISAMTRETDRACRIGGDEFVVVLEDVSEDKNIEMTAERFLKVLGTPMTFGDLEIGVGVSIGVAVFPEMASDPASLMKVADLAMYEVKSAGGNAVRFKDPIQRTSGPDWQA